VTLSLSSAITFEGTGIPRYISRQTHTITGLRRRNIQSQGGFP